MENTEAIKNARWSWLVKVRMFFHYYKRVQRINIPFSVLMALMMLALFNHPESFLLYFFTSFATGGIVLAVYLLQRRNKNLYYFYYNKGLPKALLIGGCFIVNVLIRLLYIFCKNLF